MKHYKDPNTNLLYAYNDDGSDDNIIPSHFVFITEEEAVQLRNTLEKISFDALTYDTKRKTEYPPLEDFADAWVKNDEQSLEDYRQKCLAVKAKYPKP